MQTRKSLNSEQEQQIKTLYQEGKSSTVLAQQFGCSQITVLRTLTRLGVQPRQNGWKLNRKSLIRK